MGALHNGHLSLIERANDLADVTVVSIFVNPLQFGDAGDFAGYPRPLDDDLALCRATGVAAVYAPGAEAMYPGGFDTRVVPGRLATAMEGTSRPGHFEGVTTVVAKLFGAVDPDVACFGEKDFQQLAIIRRMTADLDLGIEIIECPTLRDDDGLALSSRNRRLDPAQRLAARCIPAAIMSATRAAHTAAGVVAVVDAARRPIIDEARASIDYVTVFDPATLQPLEEITRREPGSCRLALAVRIGDVRLIDNADLFAR